MRKISLLLFAALLPSLTHLCAQNSQDQESFEVNFYALGWDNTVSDLKFYSDSKDVSFHASSSRPDGPYRYRGPGPLDFYTLTTNEEGVSTKDIQAQLPINGNFIKPLLLLFVRNPAGSPAYHIVPLTGAIDFDSPQKRNELFFLNMSESDVGLKINDQTFLLGSRQQGRYSVKPTGKYNNYELMIAQQTQGGWRPAFSTIWTENPRVQTVVFIMPDPNNPDQLSIRRFPIVPKES